ncbi:tRNA adenosine(34) deaminase TadA [Rhabdochromatium marinum]|nr:tRNA adenosine(34) deaminase TadA [Rhabdochromatium marinum]
MQQALALAKRAACEGEVPVGAVLVRDGVLIGAGWNRPLATHDPSAHAEILALRDAGQRLGNYRLPASRLYVTLEPCVMCAGAMIHARVETVIFGTLDPKAGACGSVFDLLPADGRFNHHTQCRGPILATACGELLREFFRNRRASHKGANQRRPDRQPQK